MERKPLFNCNTPDCKVFAYDDNTTVYQHVGHDQLDHVFVSDGERSGLYIWRDHTEFENIVKIAVGAKCLMILNIREPSEVDVTVYMKHHASDVDTPPDWMPEV